MALAILELVDFGRAAARFTIDTGTNRLFQLKVGRSVQTRDGIDWIDELAYSTPLATNENGGNLFRSSKEIALAAAHFADGARFVQLLSFKAPDHRAPAFSKVVEIPGARPVRLASLGASMSIAATTFAAPRRVPARTANEALAQTASVEDVLGGIVKLAAPLVQDLLKGDGKGAPKDGSGGGNDALGNVLAVLLRAILGGDKATPAAATAKSLSFAGAMSANRFADPQLSHPFIFGIDDALIGALAGPILQALPQLMNAANQHKIQMKEADNRLISDLVSDVNRRLMLQQLAGAQPPAGSAAAPSPDLAKLIQLLQQAAPAAAGGAAPTAAAKSLSLAASSTAILSSRATLGFAFADPLPWNGRPLPLFASGRGLSLRVQLNTGAPVPKTPLPKAILKLVFKDGQEHKVLFEKTFKQKGVAANAPLALAFDAGELAALPANRPIEVIAEIRWLAGGDREYKALGSAEIVLVGKYLLKSQGSTGDRQVELTDMRRFRPFWNKLWESPVLDGSGKSREDAKYLWELDVDAKYTVLLAPGQEANGLMETRLLKGAADSESLSERTEGRMKGGIELSVSELNKLLPLWSGQTELDRDKLAALDTPNFAKANAGELVTHLKLEGKAGQRGLVWAVPVFNLVELTLSSIAKTEETGQVTGLADETVRFPLPVAVRMIGLKSH